MLKMFKKHTQKKPEGFDIKSGFVLSTETINEYEQIRKLFFRSIEIFKNLSYEEDGKKELKLLLMFYENSDTLLCSLIDEIFTKRFMESIEKRFTLFELLDKIFRMFYIFDRQRYKTVMPFHNYSVYKITHRKRLNEKEVIKYSTFASIAMPMARLFLSYFSAEKYEIFHPVVLKKRTTLFLGDTKKEYLKFVCSIMLSSTDLKFCKIFMCALYEKIMGKNVFDDFFHKLNSKEKEYYIDLIELL